MRTEAMITALWRAVAKSCASTDARGHARLFPEECQQAIKVAEYVEAMLRITGKLYEGKEQGDAK